MNQTGDGWPELTYAYVKHYFWEPQHLTQTKASIARARKHYPKRIDAVDALLRTEEVPLNYLLNVLLRIAPASFRRQCLKPFGIDLTDPGLATLSLKTPEDVDSIQPDVQLESDGSRVFIELKVTASLGREQVLKYVSRHKAMNEALEKDGKPAARPYVLFLVNQDSLKLKGVQQTIPFDAIQTEMVRLLHESDARLSYADKVIFGATNWLTFAKTLKQELDRRREERADAVEMLEVLVDDFLADLTLRPNLPFEKMGLGQPT